MQQILVINSGSSSIKFKIITLPAATVLVEGSVDNIGAALSQHRLQVHIDKTAVTQDQRPCTDHQMAFEAVMKDLDAVFHTHPQLRIDAIGHRVVHGGAKFITPIQLNYAVLDEISRLKDLAPQHLPSNLLGMQICLKLFADITQVAVFDTAFHHTMPEHIYRYAVPEKWFTEYGIRRFGFHGSSHKYIADKAAQYLNKPLNKLNIISLHLGNGDSACAIQNGQSIDTSMGFTPLEGLMMGHRTGDLDASIPLYLQQRYQLSADDISHQLNFDSGLEAICGSHDMHEIIERAQADNKPAQLALEMFIYHVRKYIGAYLLELESLDALVFTGGIGEHAAEIRQRCCAGLTRFGLELDNNVNVDADSSVITEISTDKSPSKILIIPTNEELEIAKQVASLLAT